MSRLRRTGLTIDDPLAAPTATSASLRRSEEVEPTATATAGPASAARPSKNGKPAVRGPSSTPGAGAARTAAPDSAMTTQAGEPWRSWSGQTRVASYRLPDELLAELAQTADTLHLSVGLIVTAAIAHFLDGSHDAIHEIVDRADDARIAGRRATRRGVGRPSPFG